MSNSEKIDMGRGGAREGAGRASLWKHGKTQTIRVPIELADQVLEFAQTLDSGQPFKTGPRSLDLETLARDILQDPFVTRRGKDRASCKRAIDALISRLSQCR